MNKENITTKKEVKINNTFNCDYCGKEHIKTNNNYKPKMINHFCGVECYQKFRSKQFTLNNTVKCGYCDKDFKSNSYRIKRSKNNFCSKVCQNKYHSENSKGENNPRYVEKVLTICPNCEKEFEIYEWRLKGCKNNFCSRKCQGIWRSENLVGEKANNWQGGIRPIYNIVRGCPENYQWKLQCMERDKFTCQECGDAKGGNLVVHHIKHFAEIIKNNMIEKLEDAINCSELWDINNGITLCNNCHYLYHKNDRKGGECYE